MDENLFVIPIETNLRPPKTSVVISNGIRLSLVGLKRKTFQADRIKPRWNFEGTFDNIYFL